MSAGRQADQSKAAEFPRDALVRSVSIRSHLKRTKPPITRQTFQTANVAPDGRIRPDGEAARSLGETEKVR
jgi:hypothetical protein